MMIRCTYLFALLLAFWQSSSDALLGEFFLAVQTLCLFLLLTVWALYIYSSSVDRLVSRACEIAEPRIDGDDLATCECDGSFRVFGGLRAKLMCTTNMRVCYEGTTYCGFAEVDALLGARIFGRSGFLGTTITVDMDSNLPDTLTSTPPPLTVRLYPKGLNFLFNRCEMFVGDQKCSSCAVCEEGVEFTYDCSNTNLAPDSIFLPVPGPKSLTCISFMPGP